MTWFATAFAVWFCIFHEDKLCMIQSLKAEKADKIIRKAEHIIRNLPKFMLEGNEPKIMKSEVIFPNGSSIEGIPQGDKQLVSETVSLWISDEAALHDLLEAAITGSVPALEGGGRAIILSSIRPSYFARLVRDEPIGEIKDKKWMKVEHDISRPIKGIEEWQNKNNPFYVVRVHYSSNPAKDPDTPEGRQWYEREKAKYPDIRQWNQEYEIDDKALADSLIYNFIPDIHILDGVTIEDLKGLDGTIYHTADWGIDDPFAGLWFMVLPNQDVIVFDEYYVRNRVLTDHCFFMEMQERDHPGRPEICKLDPACFAREFTGTTIAGEMANDVRFPRFYSRANNDIESGIEVVRAYLRNAEHGEHPAVYFLSHLGNLFREIKNYCTDMYGNIKKRQKDHLLDGLRYGLNIPPVYLGPTGRTETVVYRDSLTGHQIYYPNDEEAED